MLENFHNGFEFEAYRFFGCHKKDKGIYVFRVWAPHARSVFIEGSFNANSVSELKRLSDGESFEISLPAKPGDRYRYVILTFDGRTLKKSDPYAFYSFMGNEPCSVVYDLPKPSEYTGIFKKFDFAH